MKLRRWPTFLVVGAARSGTTSLYHWLNQHPDVFMSPVKETNYFAQVSKHLRGPGDEKPRRPLRLDSHGKIAPRGAAYIQTRNEYEALFAGGESFPVRGEASPSYLYHRECASRIRSALPDCKIVIVLRHPAERALSHYRALVHWGREPLSLSDSLAHETERLKQGWEWSWALRGAGLYSHQVARYLEEFPRDQVGVWLFDDLVADPRELFAEVSGFVGVRPAATGIKYRAENTTPGVRESGIQQLRTRLPGLAEAFDRLPRPVKDVVRPIGVRALGTDPLDAPTNVYSALFESFTDEILALDRLLPELRIAARWLAPEDNGRELAGTTTSDSGMSQLGPDSCGEGRGGRSG